VEELKETAETISQGNSVQQEIKTRAANRLVTKFFSKFWNRDDEWRECKVEKNTGDIGFEVFTTMTMKTET
jgi:hypothetical protein